MPRTSPPTALGCGGGGTKKRPNGRHEQIRNGLKPLKLVPELRTARENARLEIGSQRGRNSHRINVLGIYDLQVLSYVAALSCWWLICDF